MLCFTDNFSAKKPPQKVSFPSPLTEGLSWLWYHSAPNWPNTPLPSHDSSVWNYFQKMSFFFDLRTKNNTADKHDVQLHYCTLIIVQSCENSENDSVKTKGGQTGCSRVNTHHVTFLFQSGLSTFCFVPFAVVCLLSALYVGLVLPETKGKSLSAISREFQQLNYRSRDGKRRSRNQAEYQLGGTCLSATVQTSQTVKIRNQCDVFVCGDWGFLSNTSHI